MTKVIYLQLAWVALGVGFNLVSLWYEKTGSMALTPTPQIPAIIFLLCIIPIVLLGVTSHLLLYAVLIVIVLGLVLYSGVGIHLVALTTDSGLQGYSSVFSLAIGVAINLFGVTVGIGGLWRATAQVLSG